MYRSLVRHWALRLSASFICAHVAVAAAAAIAATPGTADDQEWGPDIDGQAISITTDREAYAPSEPIALTVDLKNVSTDPVKYFEWYKLDQYHFSVSLPDGKPAPLTLYGKDRFSRSHSSGSSGGVLKPGQIRSTEVELSRLFDFSLEGKYTVSVERPVFVFKAGKVSSPAKAISNRLQVIVTATHPPNAKPGVTARSAEVEGAAIEISTPKRCKLGQPASLYITIRNKGDQPFFCDEKAGLPDRRMEMKIINRNTHAAVAPIATAKAKLERADAGDPSVELTELRTGEESDWSVDLNEWFALSRGSFTFSATVLLSKAAPAGEPASNIKVTINDLKFTIAD